MLWVQYGLLGFAPGLLWLWFLRGKDDLEPEPKRIVLLVFALGCGAALAVLGVRPSLEPMLPWDPVWLRDAVDAFVVTAAVEEGVKATAFLAGAFLWHRQLDEPLDGIVYGAAAALGFASVENVLYIVLSGEPTLILARAFTSTLAHVACSAGVGLCVALMRIHPSRMHALLVACGLLAAVLLHGVYDYFLLVGRSWAWISLLLALPLMVVLLGLKIRWARARSARYHPHLA